MSPQQAIDFIRRHGVVLESAKGPEPSLAEHIAGQAISGSWWGHPKSKLIFRLTRQIRDSGDVLVCTLAGGKITYIHRRLWPDFVRLARKFPIHALDKVQELHLPSGRHQRRDIPFPQWVPDAVLHEAKSLSAEDASHEIKVWLDRYGTVKR